MPNNMDQRALTDRERLQLCLELEKGRLRSVSNTLLECSHDELRDVYRSCLDTTIENQRKLFDTLQTNDWYRVRKAEQAELEDVQEMMQHNLRPST
ncbi:spore coat protein [Salsuginibacillus kocurii]|uniref:spore coat protein n=1 Tax=Salsuginibacillus kocurii TaxID=427078 RepID=UPI00037B61B9|nr:spore coat protein [Salsuginibacillus kocurii]